MEKVWVYKAKESKLVTREQADGFYKDGWADSPDYETCPGIHSKKAAPKAKAKAAKESVAEEKPKEFSEAIKKS